MSARRLLVAGALSACALSPRAAAASEPLDVIGAVGGNGGVQAETTGASAASTYFNPAFLTESNDDLVVGYALLSEQISVTLDGRNGGDVPISVAGRNIILPDGTPIANDSVPTQWLRNGCPPGTTPGTCPPPGFAARPRQSHAASGVNRSYAVAGIVRHAFDNHLALGFYALVPVGNFTTAREFLPDERESLFTNSLYPELYGDRMTALSLAFGAGVKITQSFSLGVGVSLGVQNTAQSATYVRDSSNYDILIINNDIATSVSASPTFGARWEPAKWLRLGAAAHAPEEFAIDTNVTAELPNGATANTIRHDVFDYVPWRFSLGAEGDVLSTRNQTLSVAATANYSLWSDYKDRHGQSPSVYGQDLAWKNTLGGALGLRYHAGRFRELVDFVYAPSPVPEQIGRSNYVDNDRVGIRVGSDVRISIGSTDLTVGLQLFGDRLVARHNQKDNSRIVDELPDNAEFTSTHEPVPGAQGLQTNNPGWPGFGSAGWLYGGGLTLGIPL